MITTLDGKPVAHWMLLDQMLQSQPDRAWQIGWLRTADGGTAQAMHGTLVQARITVTDEFGNASLRLYLGAINDVEKLFK